MMRIDTDTKNKDICRCGKVKANFNEEDNLKRTPANKQARKEG
jgi:hypothetical protein